VLPTLADATTKPAGKLLLCAFSARLTAFAPNVCHMLTVTGDCFAALASDCGHVLFIAGYLLPTFTACGSMPFRVAMPTAPACVVVLLFGVPLGMSCAQLLLRAINCHERYSLISM
jgi:hypothetical protein